MPTTCTLPATFFHAGFSSSCDQYFSVIQIQHTQAGIAQAKLAALGIQKPSSWPMCFVIDLLICFLSLRVFGVHMESLSCKTENKISVYYNSEAFLSSAVWYKIMHLIHNIAMLCYFWHFKLSFTRLHVTYKQ